MNKKRNKILTVCFLAVCVLFGSVLSTAMDCSAMTLKQKYTKRYKKLEKKCKEKYTYDAPQQTMNLESYEEYKLWDKELNTAYQDVYKRLSASAQKKLKKSEQKWIRKKEKKAEKEAKWCEGGSMYAMVYNRNLTGLTKKRIKWLIKNYM